MTDHGTYITVEEDEADIATLLGFIRERGQPIRIVSHGAPVADLSPAAVIPARQALPAPDPTHRVVMLEGYNPTECATDDEWPEEAR